MNQYLSKTYTQDFTNAAKSLNSHQIHEKWDEKITARYIFQNKCYFSIFFCPLFLGTWKNVLNFQNVICFYIPYIFSFFYFWMLQFTDRFSSLNHQAYWKRKKKGSKCYLTISNFHKTVWLLPFWIGYGNNYELFVFPESKFNVYLCNLGWHHNKFQTLTRSLISWHWKFGKLISCVLVISMPIFRFVEFVELQN